MAPEEEQISFEHLPRILSLLQRDVKEIKNFIVRNSKQSTDDDEWMDVKALQAYHPNRPAARTIYDWIHGKRIRFKRSEIDEWLLTGYHRTHGEVFEDTIDIINSKRTGSY